MKIDITTIPARDGFQLAATVFQPDTPVQRTVVIAPATGVKRLLYHDFASYLAEQGLNVITWDWRGTGESRPASLRGFQANMRQWGTLDLASVIDWAEQKFPGELAAVGHSFGGQSLGMPDNRHLLKRIVSVTAGSGYFGLWPKSQRWKYRLLWYVLAPVLTKLFGYFPGKLLRIGEDLPAGVMRQWARWCRRPDYLRDVNGHATIQAPLLVYGFRDDPFAPPRAVDWLQKQYASAYPKQLRYLAPEQLGVSRIGHWRFFRKDYVPSIWAETAAWLLSGETLHDQGRVRTTESKTI